MNLLPIVMKHLRVGSDYKVIRTHRIEMTKKDGILNLLRILNVI